MGLRGRPEHGSGRRGVSREVVSVGVLTVEHMSTRTHVCVYFDDGELDHGCVCGSRAILVVGEDGLEALVVVGTDDGATVTTLTTGRLAPHELLVSA